jgi:hypothetical protein
LSGAPGFYVFTSIAPNYLAKARVLAGLVKRHSPEARFCVWVADFEPPAWAGRIPEFDEVRTLAGLPLDNLSGWTFSHSLVELCTAIKGFALQDLLAREDCRAVFFFDPDVVLFSPLEELAAELQRGSVLLTPHLTAPDGTLEAVLDNECSALRHGVYNLGFLAVRNDGEGRRFADWWCSRLRDLCYDEIPRGLFTDQRWVDLAPAFFPSVVIVRDPGWNVATWNLTHRQVQGSLRDGFVVNGATPLRFFHFSGLDSGAQLAMLKKYGAAMPALFELRKWYLAECLRLEAAVPVADDWRLGRFGNGAPISQEHRVLYREREDLRAAFPDPYAADDVNASFFHWFEVNYRTVAAEADETSALLSLYRAELERIHRSRAWRLVQRASRLWRRLQAVAGF